ncbi:MAG: potassium channel family protein [Actinomycetota bacterium]|nr:potassium channel family protein [Actinomycetota bacterium]
MWRPARRTTYAGVVALVLATYAVSLAVEGAAGSAVAALLQVLTVRLSLVHSGAGRRVLRFADLVLVATGVLVVAVPTASALGVGPSDVTLTVAYLLNAVLYAVAPVSILRDVTTRDRVDGSTVLATVAAYLQIGIFFAFTFRVLASVTPAFPGPVDTADLMFFSFVTLTTTGYGNVVPTGWVAQTVAVIEVVVGQFFLVAAVGKIVAVWVPRRGPH